MADETVAITKKPQVKVIGLTSLTRNSGGSRVFKSTWGVSSNAKKNTNPARVQGYDIWINLNRYKPNGKKLDTLTYKRRSMWADREEWEFNLSSFMLYSTSQYTFTRAKNFFPGNPNAMLRSMEVMVRCVNSKGVGAWTKATRQLFQPRNPSITKLEHDEDTGLISIEVTHDKGEDYREVWHTKVTVDLYDSVAGKYLADSHKVFYISTNETTGTASIDAYNRMDNDYEAYREVTVTAVTRGLWGDSATVENKLQIGWPTKPVIQGVEVSQNDAEANTYADADGKVTVSIDTGTHPYSEARTNTINHHPSTGVKLEKLVDSTYRTAYEIPGNAEWNECGAVDNGICTALSSTIAELRSTRGNYTWIRVKSWNTVEDIFFRYSNPVRMDEVYLPPIEQTDDEVYIHSLISDENGKSAVVTVRWVDDDSDSTEVSWSDYKNAWLSTDEPDTYLIDRTDGTVVDGDVTYNYAVLYVSGLSADTTYYFRARRVQETEEDPLYGPYCTTMTVTPYPAPESVTIVTPGFSRIGASIPVSWSFESEATQKRWELITGPVTATEASSDYVSDVDPETGFTTTRYEIADESVVQVLASGNNELTGCTVDWETISDKIVNENQIFMAVRVDTGGGYVMSDASLTTVAEAPTITSVSADTVRDQPLIVTVTCDSDAAISMTVSSRGIVGETADGMLVQADGDMVWSYAGTPSWSGSGPYEVMVIAPDGLDLHDGGTYLVTCVATDPTSGLKSEEATCEFAVSYAHKAAMPSDSISVAPYDTTDATTGYRTRGCVVTLEPPTYNVAEWFTHDLDDVYDAADNPSGYWASDAQHTYGTSEGDGWISLDIPQSTTVSISPIEAALDYEEATLLIEWHDASAEATIAISSGRLDPDESSVSVTEGDGSAHVTCSVGYGRPLVTLSIASESAFMGSLRVSTYDGAYDGPYISPENDSSAVRNVAEWFSHDLSDTDYWDGTDQQTYGNAAGEGWLSLEVGSSASLSMTPAASEFQLTVATMLIEWRNATDDATMTLTGGQLVNAAGPLSLTAGSGSIAVLCDIDDEDILVTLGIQTTGAFGCNLRVSTYDGAYDGAYRPPYDSSDVDVYDVYRITPDGYYICAEGVALDAVVDDPWAPYGETIGYRVSLRTKDGCEDWADYSYQLKGRDLRIDFDGQYVELPYNVGASDQYEKDFEARRHLDGSVDGYWNEGIIRRGSLKTDIIKTRDAEKAALIRALGRHAGPCYVRTPDGCAYEADVQVSGLERQSASFAMAVSISATEVSQTGLYTAETREV